MGQQKSDVEETETHKTKDSGYSNSCSNSQSQRSSGSSKSHSTSSGSSGYCGHLANSISDGDKTVKRKEKEHKKKKDVSGGVLKEPAPLPELPVPVEKRKGAVEGGEESSESLQRAALTQTLTTMKRIKCKELSPDVENSSHGQSVEKISEDDVLQLFKADRTASQEEEVGVVVSMLDGLVVHTTPSLCQLLGYPRDMWVGRSLIDFVHPMHRASFAGHITSVIANSHNGSQSGRRNSFSCYLRQYRGLRNSGFSITEKWVGYLPCSLGMNFKEVSGYGEATRFYLVITASPIRSAYKYGDETVLSPKFTTRHTASAQLCHVDPEVTPYFGYLPQDMLGRSVLDYYHPEDLHFIKEVYEAVMKEQGHLFRSKPYRFRCQNGTFALVETEVSSFIQPWSRKLEFVICQHTVLRGPSNPDVTTPVSEPEPLQISEEVLKETKIVQEEIKYLLNETLVHNSETAKQQVSKRCKDLAAFMENLMDELTKPPDLKVDVPTEEQSFSERDSVMFGEISPHHEYYDSKSSSETPPSYNQLNYNENIQRFFESKPKTTISDESGESKVGSGGEEGKISPVIDSSSGCKSGGSGGSSGAQSSERNSAGENSGSNVNTAGSNSKPVDQCYKPATLTEQLLSRHNEDMEKQMVQRHREQRCKSERDLKAKERVKPNHDKDEGSPHGVKRSGSHSWEGEPYKSIKASHNTPEAGSTQQEPKIHTSSQLFPFSTRPDYRGPAFASTLMPMYYIANGRTDYPLFSQQNVPYLSGMVYHPAVMFGPQPLVYSPLAMVHPSTAATHQEMAPSSKNNQQHITSPPQVSCGVRQMSAVVSSQKQLTDQNSSNDTSNPFDDSTSSFYSLLKTDKSDESLPSLSENDAKTEEGAWNQQRRTTERIRKQKKLAPWLVDVNLNSDLVLKYQMKERPLQQILSQDLNQLQTFNQPQQVSEQLSQMYLDLELEGLSKQLTLEEGVTSSSDSSEDEDMCHNICSSQRKKYMEYDQMAILFEEDAPLPPPIQSCT